MKSIFKPPRAGLKTEGRSAFTLVELLVVVASCVILLALLLIGSSGLMAKGRQAKCVANQRQILTAMLAYAGENNGKFPPYAIGFPEQPPYWVDSIAPYLGVPDRQYIGYEFLRCPAAPDNAGATIGVNYAPSPYGIFSYLGPDNPGTLGSRPLARVGLQTMLIADRDPNIGGINIYSPYTSPFNGDSDGDGTLDSCNGIRYNAFSPRHGGAAVCGFADGSVKLVPLKDWLTNENGIWGPYDW